MPLASSSPEVRSNSFAPKSSDSMADYTVRDLKTGEILDGSSASGYGVALTIFQELCPGIAK